MPGEEFEEQPFEDTGETPPEEGGAEGTEGGEDQPWFGEAQPAAQDETIGAAEPEAGAPSPEELDELDRSMTAERKEMGPTEDFDTALAEADTTPSDIEPTSPA